MTTQTEKFAAAFTAWIDQWAVYADYDGTDEAVESQNSDDENRLMMAMIETPAGSASQRLQKLNACFDTEMLDRAHPESARIREAIENDSVLNF